WLRWSGRRCGRCGALARPDDSSHASLAARIDLDALVAHVVDHDIAAKFILAVAEPDVVGQLHDAGGDVVLDHARATAHLGVGAAAALRELRRRALRTRA